ncbi:slipin family protein [Paenimyroides aestuarii]|uniref:Slipin family protein n=1 Tax=Paenimyroides aestuarii TaxID=2968490 RepID=A0ABY5NR94_9FLAO|nr:slipin family protein [Paenimyroides aestuarii]UUV21080.1 slipin family protein [Paenimyroides aestuarii]
MKKITLNEQEAALVIKNKKIVNVLFAGTYWFFLGEKIEKFNTSQEFPKLYQGIFDNDHLKNYLEIITVADDELVLKFQNNVFDSVLTAGVYAFWKDKNPFQFQKISITNYITNEVSKVILEKPQLNLYVRNYRIESYEKGLLIVDGKFVELLDTGNYFWWKNSQVITAVKGDTRQQNMEVNGQEILTKDKVQLRLNFAIQYQIVDFVKAFAENKEFENQLYIIVQMALRTLVGTMTFDELMDQKSKIAETISLEIMQKVNRLGVKIIDTGLKDIILPGEIRDIMNQVLIAEKKAQANSIMRREETASTRSLLNTAKLMDENQMLYKLKEMEYIEKIAEKINTISVSGRDNIVSELKQIFTK